MLHHLVAEWTVVQASTHSKDAVQGFRVLEKRGQGSQHLQALKALLKVEFFRTCQFDWILAVLKALGSSKLIGPWK